MVLGEFSEDEKEVVFSDLILRKNLIRYIKEKVPEELSEFKNNDVIINLALEYFLEQLEKTDNEEDIETFISGVEQVYLMANYEFIKAYILK